jgi:FAD/FMN-containing dehydrogenase
MNRILEIDLENLRAVVEPGLVNLRLSQAVAHEKLLYVPDPSSQKACTIGGNVGENSGGPHTLRYGVTTNHTLGLEYVLLGSLEPGRFDSHSVPADDQKSLSEIARLIRGSAYAIALIEICNGYFGLCHH